MAILITHGTKEYLPVTIVDEQGLLSSLTTPTYDVVFDNESFLYNDAVGVAVGLVVKCMLDLSATGPNGLIAVDTRLRVFISFTDTPEIPRLGPIVLRVVDEGM